MMTYGSDRMTADVDVMTDDPTLSLGKPGKALSFGGRSFLKQGVVLDVIIRADDQKDVYDAALQDTRMRVPWRGEAKIETLSPEWLALIKFLAGRSKDVADMKYLICHNIVDRELLIQHCRNIYGKHAYTVTDDLKQEFLLADAGIGG